MKIPTLEWSRRTDRQPRRTAVFAALAFIAIVMFGLACGPAAAQPAAAPSPLAANDVSILFPVPRTAGDLDNLIALAELSGPSGSPQPSRLWSEADFASFLAIAERPALQVAGQPPISLPSEVKRIEAWFIAGIRIDAGAPGLSQEIIEQYGQQPQIRFIAQPVVRLSGGQIRVHDIVQKNLVPQRLTSMAVMG